MAIAEGNRSLADTAPTGVHLGVTVRSGCAVVNLSGELDLSSAAEVHDVIVALADAGGVWRVEIDGSRLDFVDAAGLTALFAVRDDLATRSLCCSVIDRSPALQRILDLTGAGGSLVDSALN